MEAISLRTPARAFPDSHARNVGSEDQACAQRDPMLQHKRTRLVLEMAKLPPATVPGRCRAALALRWWHYSSQRCLIACSSTNTPFRNRQKGPVYPYSKPTCTNNGADWVAPSKGCECALFTSHGLDTYPTLSSPVNATTASCNFSVLPASTAKPVTTGPALTKVPGLNGVPECAEIVIHQWGIESYSILSEWLQSNHVEFPNKPACLHANYCKSDSLAVLLLTETSSGQAVTHCAARIKKACLLTLKHFLAVMTDI